MALPPRLVVATRNPGKRREFAEIFEPHGTELLAPPDEMPEPVEDGETFEANALIKARATHAATGLPAFADDSGIAVAALGGRPGVRSARYAGEHATDEENLDLLLSELAPYTDPARRGAAYVAAIAYVDGSGEPGRDGVVVEARCEGVLIGERRGGGGFGYDPVFVPLDTGPADERTMAELSPAEKHAISHRGRAARLLVERLQGP
ncbi:RdgB/HAM1 family non-canonical purine NTP pyrophosphatase [Thermoleophilia bacterium SCSIO 60948]|nr:RdgB/HAM1 family non-canonical purine NTP pyrophosphatase [Thermoleophilia bacterium SCSIO 60948]